MHVHEDKSIVDEVHNDFVEFTNYLDHLITSLMSGEEKFQDHIANSMLDSIEDQFRNGAKEEILNLKDREEQIEASLSHLLYIPATVTSSQNYLSTLSVNPKLASLVYGLLLEPLADITLDIDSTSLFSDDYENVIDEEDADLEEEEVSVYEAVSGSQNYENQMEFDLQKSALESLEQLPNLSIDLMIDYRKRELVDYDYFIRFVRQVASENMVFPDAITEDLMNIFSTFYEEAHKDELLSDEDLEELVYLLSTLSRPAELKISLKQKNELLDLALNYPDNRVNYFALRALSKAPFTPIDSKSKVREMMNFAFDDDQYSYKRIAAVNLLSRSDLSDTKNLKYLIHNLFLNENFDSFAYAILAQQIFRKPELAKEITDQIWDRLEGKGAENRDYDSLPFLFLTQFDPASDRALNLLKNSQEILESSNSTLMMAYLYRFQDSYKRNLDLEESFEQFRDHMIENKESGSQAFIYESAISGFDYEAMLSAISKSSKETDDLNSYDAGLLSLGAVKDEFFDLIFKKYFYASPEELKLMLTLLDKKLGNGNDQLRSSSFDAEILGLEDAEQDYLVECNLATSFTDEPSQELIDKYMKFIYDNYTNSLFGDNPEEVGDIIRRYTFINKEVLRPKIEKKLSQADQTMGADFYARIYKVFDLGVANQANFKV